MLALPCAARTVHTNHLNQWTICDVVSISSEVSTCLQSAYKSSTQNMWWCFNETNLELKVLSCCLTYLVDHKQYRIINLLAVECKSGKTVLHAKTFFFQTIHIDQHTPQRDQFSFPGFRWTWTFLALLLVLMKEPYTSSYRWMFESRPVEFWEMERSGSETKKV